MTDPGYAVAATSPRSRGVALTLAVLLGVFGVHRFYAGRIQSGILQLCTFGGLGIWAFYDCIMLATGNFRDAEGRRIRRWDPQEWDPEGELPPEVLEEIDGLHQQIAELTERLDFAERMLADPARARGPRGD